MQVAHRMRPYVVPLLACLGLGALLGWMLAGWPVQGASNAEPWDLRPVHQVRYVDAVAADYARTADAGRARAALAGWDAEALAETLALAASQSPDPEEAQRLATLRDALALPEVPWSWRTLLGDPLVRGGLGAAGGLAALAVGIALWPTALWGAERRVAAGAPVGWEQLSAEQRRMLVETLQGGGVGPSSVPGSADASWEEAAQGVADHDLQAAEGERTPPPVVQQAPTGEQPHKEPPAAGAKTATWQPQPPAGDGSAQPQDEAAAQTAEDEQAPQQAAASAQKDAKAPEAKDGSAGQGEQQPGPQANAPVDALATQEEPAEEAVSVDSALLDDLFQEEAEESMARHVLTRDLDEIDVSALAQQAVAIAEALARAECRVEER